MGKWRVYNEHPDGLAHVEVFREEKYVIPAGKFILMDYEDAVLFKGQYFPMKMLPTGAPDRTTFKVIRIAPDVADAKVEKQEQKWICHMDGKEFPSKAELEAYVSARYGEQVFVDEALEDQIKAEAPQPKRRSRRSAEKEAVNE